MGSLSSRGALETHEERSVYQVEPGTAQGWVADGFFLICQALGWAIERLCLVEPRLTGRLTFWLLRVMYRKTRISG